MKVYIVLDNSENTDENAIVGVSDNLDKAKILLADYILEKNTSHHDYIYIVEKEVK